ncbi:MAG TPA: ATP-binding protein, partial [Opitutaceae bacterium]|nr:ATP-binding protein [Opitutaceae bacterium]
MLLDRLQIHAFRGIRDTIELPLDAPLTILLAANGTAKTTVCDATEWLLTGRIRRLQPGLIGPQTIRNLYAQAAQPRVWATARWRTMAGEIVRTEPSSLTVPVARGTGRKVATTGKLLEQLTPDYVGQTSRTRNVEEPRAEWLRAVRFFTSDGLGLLLDDGEVAERVRGIAFAELLGVGPVGRRIEGLKGVRAQIDSPRAALSAVTDRIAILERQLREQQSSISAPYLARVDALLRAIGTASGV